VATIPPLAFYTFVITALVVTTAPQAAKGAPAENEIDAAMAAVADATVRAEKADDDQLDRLREAWKKKCPKREDDSPCFLTEEDVGLGHSQNVLLFRGEPDRFPTPMTASILRDLAKPSNTLCPASCTFEKLSTNLAAIFSELIGKVKVVDRPGGWFPLLYYVQKDKSWKELDGSQPTDKLYLKDLEAPDQKKSLTKLNLVADSHVIYAVSMLLTDGSISAPDPLVSFSPSPEVALHFTGTKGKTGRLFVLSVPKAAIYSQAGCDGWLGKAGSDLTSSLVDCAASDREDHSGELEVDAFFVGPIQSLSEVLLVSHEWFSKHPELYKDEN